MNSSDILTVKFSPTEIDQIRREHTKAANAERAKRYRDRKKHRALEAIARKQAREGSAHASSIHDASDALETVDVRSASDSKHDSRKRGNKSKRKRDDKSSQNARHVTNVTPGTENVTSISQSSFSSGKVDAKTRGTQDDQPARDAREPDPERVAEIKRRIDGSLARTSLTPEFKRALQETYANDLGVDFRALAKATGTSKGALIGAVLEAPRLVDRARQNRQLMTIEDLEAGLAILAKRFREQAEAGQLDPTTKNMRDFSIMYGVITDKRQLLAGRSTKNVELHTHLTIDERKQRMRDVLERARTVAARFEEAS